MNLEVKYLLLLVPGVSSILNGLQCVAQCLLILILGPGLDKEEIL